MGNIQATKLIGTLLIVGPLLTVICYFIQQFGVLGTDVDPTSVAETAPLWADASELTIATAVLIAFGVALFVHGIFFIANEIRSGGEGAALAGSAMPFIMVGFVGIVAICGLTIAGANITDAAGQGFMTAVSVGTVASGINAITGIFFGIGFTLIFLAIASRDEYNSTLAYIAAIAAVVAVVASIIAISNIEQAKLMTQIIGITYIIHVIYFIILGRGILSRD